MKTPHRDAPTTHRRADIDKWIVYVVGAIFCIALWAVAVHDKNQQLARYANDKGR